LNKSRGTVRLSCCRTEAQINYFTSKIVLKLLKIRQTTEQQRVKRTIHINQHIACKSFSKVPQYAHLADTCNPKVVYSCFSFISITCFESVVRAYRCLPCVPRVDSLSAYRRLAIRQRSRTTQFIVFRSECFYRHSQLPAVSSTRPPTCLSTSVAEDLPRRQLVALFSYALARWLPNLWISSLIRTVDVATVDKAYCL
jgi:hypothetical protein